MKRTNFKQMAAKCTDHFFYKKPSISFEVNMSYGALAPTKRNHKSRDGVSKTKTFRNNDSIYNTKKPTLNWSAVNPSERQTGFSKKNSSQIIQKRTTMLSQTSWQTEYSQMSKLSPRSLMNVKSKEILYKSFIRDYNSTTEGINNLLTKEDVVFILQKMGYISQLKSNDPKATGLNKYVEYLLKLSKEILPNLKIILICIESFYQVHKHFESSSNSKQSSRGGQPKGWFNFSKKSMSPELKDNHQNSIKASSCFNSRWFSPKSNLIKYDSRNNIIDVPEEYEDFLRKKFSKLSMHRSAVKKNESRNVPTISQNLSASGFWSKKYNTETHVPSANKENEPIASTRSAYKNLGLIQKKETLKSLTKTLLAKELSKRNSTLCESQESVNSSLLKADNSQTKTPKTWSLKQSQSTSKIWLKNASKSLFQKVLSKTPKANKFWTVAPKPAKSAAFKKRTCVEDVN